MHFLVTWAMIAQSYQLIDGIWAVETERGSDFMCKLGDHGNSRGPLQCGWAAWKDADMQFGKWQDCDTLEYSTRVFWRYTNRYAGTDPTFEDRARCWNGGPDWRNKDTNEYWARVQGQMKSEKRE